MYKTIFLSILLLVAVAGLIFFGVSRTQEIKPAAIIALNPSPSSRDIPVQKPIETQEKPVALIAVGDVMLSRLVAKKMQANGADYPFRSVRDYLKSADMVFGNLEMPIIGGREIKNYEMVFRGNPGVETALRDAGFSVVSLANNHVPDFGEEGVKDTVAALRNVEIRLVGAGANETEAYAPAFLTRKGIIFAFLAYNDIDVVPPHYGAGAGHAGTALMDIPRMTEGVRRAGEKADVVIVSMHSGTEYAKTPNRSQIDFAHAAIDAGAELVIGHHPHVVEPAEIYKGKLILYSLGNFVFDQTWSRETREGMMAQILFTRSGVRRIEFTPVLIEDASQPRILKGEAASAVLDRLKIKLMDGVLTPSDAPSESDASQPEPVLLH